LAGRIRAAAALIIGKTDVLDLTCRRGRDCYLRIAVPLGVG
jgi:hypothetical protein